jgi:hypothetical protein
VVTREQKIEQSVQDYVRDMLFNRFGYPADEVELLDSFPTNRFDRALDHTYVALGFNFDDGGRSGEMGSDLKRRIYTVELFVFGHTSLWGRNVGNAVKAALEQESSIPIKDIAEPTQPIIDNLTIPPGGLRVSHVAVRDPRPWEENVWLCRVNLEDYYFAALV